jgi:hypothetical protein
MEVETVVPRAATAGAEDGPPVVLDGTTGLDLLIDAADEVSAQKLHLSFGITDPSYWTKVKNGARPAPRIDQLLNPPVTVQRAMCRRWARMLGMHVTTEDHRRTVLAELIEAAGRALKEIA